MFFISSWISSFPLMQKKQKNKQNRNLLLDNFPSLPFLLSFNPYTFQKTPNHPATSSPGVKISPF